MTYRHFRLMTTEEGHTLYWNSETKAGIAADLVCGFVVENDDGSFCVAVLSRWDPPKPDSVQGWTAAGTVCASGA